MTVFRNAKIGTKLFGSFSILLALMTASGVYAFTELSRVNDSTVALSTNWLPSVRAILRSRPS